MSTSDQNGPQLTRKQLRELRLTGSTPVVSPEDVAAADATPDDSEHTQLTRREMREQERIRTGSVPVQSEEPQDVAAPPAHPTPPEHEVIHSVPAPAAVDPEPEAVESEPEAVESEPEAVESEPAVVEVEPAAVEPESAVVEVEPEAVDPEPEAADPEPVEEQPEPEARPDEHAAAGDLLSSEPVSGLFGAEQAASDAVTPPVNRPIAPGIRPIGPEVGRRTTFETDPFDDLDDLFEAPRDDRSAVKSIFDAPVEDDEVDDESDASVIAAVPGFAATPARAAAAAPEASDVEPEPVAAIDRQPVRAHDVTTKTEAPAADERPRVGAAFGIGVKGHGKAEHPAHTRFDDLLDAGGAGSQKTATALIFTPSAGAGSLSGPIASTGELLVTGTYTFPEGVGSQGHALGAADGREVDAVLLDGELAPASSPTPIAASSAVSTLKPAGEVIRPPAPEKGGKLTLTLAIVAGGLCIALATVLIIAATTGVFG